MYGLPTLDMAFEKEYLPFLVGSFVLRCSEEEATMGWMKDRNAIPPP